MSIIQYMIIFYDRFRGRGWCAVKSGDIIMPYHSIIFLKDMGRKWIIISSPRD
jgi:hypothetical protein